MRTGRKLLLYGIAVIAFCGVTCTITSNVLYFVGYFPNPRFPPRGKPLEAYTEVISMLQDGTLGFGSVVVKLPPQFEFLSDTGSIYVYEIDGVLQVFFYQNAGILGEGWGYVYSSDDTASPLHDCDRWEHTNEPHWFLCDDY